MAIKIEAIENILTAANPPLSLVSLHALDVTREPYETLLLQPPGIIRATAERIGHADEDLGLEICKQFLIEAVDTNADLVVAPEYCVPWTLAEQISQNLFLPPKGAIWILGCESITPADLDSFAIRFRRRQNVFLHYEQLAARQISQKKYVDPLLYVFWSTDQQGTETLCMVVQFKTIACRDYFDVEVSSLCLGTTIYSFNRGLGKIGLLSIICSDAFDFTPCVDDYHHNCLLIHIQLNPKPAHVDYAAYRERLCAVGSNSNVELLCLNWAQNIQEVSHDGTLTPWNNVAGSAWYVPPQKFNSNDQLIDELHGKGLYYSLLREHWHSFFLNFEAQIISIKKHKLLFVGPQALLPKTCLSVTSRKLWDSHNRLWKFGEASDGFATVLLNYQNISVSLQGQSRISPLSVERALELLVGPKGAPTTWHQIGELDSMHLDRTEESIRRATVHQEVAPTRPGVIFRKQRLQRAEEAIGLPGKNIDWPRSLSDLENGFSLSWSAANPYHNIISTSENGKPAALVYLADEADDSVIHRIYRKVREGLISFASNKAVKLEKPTDEIYEDVVRIQDRFCVVFRRQGSYLVHVAAGQNFFDVPVETSTVDIAGEEND